MKKNPEKGHPKVESPISPERQFRNTTKNSVSMKDVESAAVKSSRNTIR